LLFGQGWFLLKKEQPHFSHSTSSFISFLVSESHPNLQHGNGRPKISCSLFFYVTGGQPTLPTSKNTGWGGQSFYLCGARILPEV
jgi:hypothetical protein